jgi:hypothetical protein
VRQCVGLGLCYLNNAACSGIALEADTAAKVGSK